MILNLNKVLIVGILVITASCGNKSKNSEAPVSSASLFEQQCSDNNVPQESVTIELKSIYDDIQNKQPLSFFNLPEKNYDYKNPMVVNLADIQQNVIYIKNQLANDEYREANFTSIAHDVFFEYQKALRYEGMKCSLDHLIAKKATDISPYMSMKDFCLAKNNSELCTMDTLLNLSLNEENMVVTNSLKMCNSLTNDPNTCQVQYSLETVNATQNSFKKNFYDSLFKLRSSHLQFNCQREDDVTNMIIRVYRGGWEAEKLQSMMEYVSDKWSRNNFKLTIVLSDVQGADVIELIPTNRAVSYVPDNNNRQIYLSQVIDSFSQKKVLAHEFGHVLGFPDCYTEFYDNEKNSLIYYEISKDNTNIMCSLKSGVSVPDDYLDQLAQKSCLFQ